MGSAQVGVLVMAYGSPATLEVLAAYYTHIRRGRPPTDEQLAELAARYHDIGGTSPLRARTAAQVHALATALDQLVPGGYRVELGLKHAPPFIEDGVAAFAAAGVGRVIALVLAPHFSAMSVGEYVNRSVAAGLASTPQVRVVAVESWHQLPEYVAFLTRVVAVTRDRMPPDSAVVFTAHSLPARIVETGDPYPAQLAETAAAVAARLDLPRWSVAWQSAGRTPDPWLGPDIAEVIRDLAADGVTGVVVCPCGFVSDHLEVLYDLDVVAAGVAAECGVEFARTDLLNDDPEVMRALARTVHERATTATW